MNDNMTPEQAAKLIVADQQARINAVRAGMDALLKQHRCQLKAEPQISDDGRLVAVILVLPL
jgi:hypothetical protein